MDKQEETALVNFFLKLRRRKKFLIVNTAWFTILALVISLLLPKWYRAEATILGGRSQISELGLGSFVQDLPLGGLGLLPQSDESLRYLAILNSRTVLMEIADKFDLQARYDTPNWEKTFEALTSNVDIEINPDETITVAVLDKSPTIAAQMANTFVHLLDSLNIQLKVEKARNNRIFLETRLSSCEEDLALAEQRLKEFQEKHGVFDVPEQTKAAISHISELEAQILIKETELRTKSHYISFDHPELEQLRYEIQELKRSLRQFKQGANGSNFDFEDGELELLLPTNEVPQLGMQYFRLLRDIEVQNIIYKYLVQQLEQARFLETKQTPTIQVLDRAVPPIYKDRPKRALIVLGAFFFSVIAGLTYVVVTERWEKLKQQMDERTSDDDA